MFDAKEARYRIEAENCRYLAAKAVGRLDKDALQLMVEEWLRLAEVRPRRETSPPPCGGLT